MNKIVKIEHEDNEIALPVDKENLGRFVSSLLGQPQSLEKIFTKPFIANHEYFINLMALITQRLKQQNDYKIVSFNANITYTDETRRQITTFEAFQHFSETLKVKSSGLKINLVTLVNFPQKDIPEKQEIDIRFYASAKELRKYIVDVSGVISVEIRHTERTWGDDMLTIIENSFNDIWVKESIQKRFFKKSTSILKNEFIRPIFILVSMLPLMFSLNNSKNNQYQDEYIDASNVYGSNIEGLHEKIDFLASIEFGKLSSNSTILIPMMMIITVMCTYLLILTLDKYVKPHPSFVVLTKSTEKHMKEVLKKGKQKLIIFSIMGTVFLGVVSAFIHDYLKNI